MKKIKSPIDLYYDFRDKKVILRANEWALYDDYYADRMKRIYPFVSVAIPTEEDLRLASEIKKSPKPSNNPKPKSRGVSKKDKKESKVKAKSSKSKK